ncbi:MAG TPA: carboxylesterase family protein, partial [Gammaproteobacteria bacterium]|nr:carboxylesterase family protein [Gammaproteobacteria bacterium]
MNDEHRLARRLIDRRSFIGTGLAAAGVSAFTPWSRLWAQDIRGAKPSRVVNTTAGRVQGAVLGGDVNAFYGVPYGASTGGANRFMPPRKPTPWAGVRPAAMVGHRSPQDFEGPISEVEALDRREPMGEDCLNLNVFTPGLGRGSRPVMVWLHGGGFTSGSGNWLLYDGTRLARSQDVVVVPVTHRLNVFGFLYLPRLGGQKYAESANVGMLDIVAALEWVRDNIAEFGGDPSNVTIFGQSGGGGKVAALMGMPSAKGLFHRAIGMSGAMIQGISTDQAEETTRKFMGAVGAETVDQMQELPMETLRDVFIRTRGLRLSPTADGRTLQGPFAPAASEITASVPMMLSTVEEEVNFIPSTPLDPMDDATLLGNVKRAARADDDTARHLIDVYRQG